MVSAWLTTPRHLFAVFLVVAALVATAFGWLSWRVIEQDRALDRQRLLEWRDADADAAVNSLQRTLLDILNQVAGGTPPSDDAVLTVFSAAGIHPLLFERFALLLPVPPALAGGSVTASSAPADQSPACSA